MAALKPNDQIVMASGIHGRVAKLGDKTVVVEIAPRMQVVVDRTAVQSVEKSAGAEKPSFPPLITGTPPGAHPGAGVPPAVIRCAYTSPLPSRRSLHASSAPPASSEMMAGEIWSPGAVQTGFPWSLHPGARVAASVKLCA